MLCSCSGLKNDFVPYRQRSSLPHLPRKYDITNRTVSIQYMREAVRCFRLEWEHKALHALHRHLEKSFIFGVSHFD